MGDALGPVSNSLRLLRHRNFGPYFVGNLLSNCGTWFQTLAQTLLVYRLTNSIFLVGVVNFAQFVGMFVLSAVVGGRRRPVRPAPPAGGHPAGCGSRDWSAWRSQRHRTRFGGRGHRTGGRAGPHHRLRHPGPDGADTAARRPGRPGPGRRPQLGVVHARTRGRPADGRAGGARARHLGRVRLERGVVPRPHRRPAGHPPEAAGAAAGGAGPAARDARPAAPRRPPGRPAGGGGGGVAHPGPGQHAHAGLRQGGLPPPRHLRRRAGRSLRRGSAVAGLVLASPHRTRCAGCRTRAG